MIERLQHALEHIESLSPEAQNDLAELIEEQAIVIASATPELAGQAELLEHPAKAHLPERIRIALAAIGSSRDLQEDDEFTALDRIRHESVPTPPIELDDL